MSEEFVRKDTYNVEVRRLDERIDAAVLRIEASLAEMKAQNALFHENVTNELADMRSNINQLKSEMLAMTSELKFAISALRSDVNNISKNVALIVTIFGLAISAVSILIQVWK